MVTGGDEPQPADPQGPAAAPVAENVDLSEPLHRDPALAPPAPPGATAPAPEPPAPTTSTAPTEPPAPRTALDLLGEHVLPGTSARLVWSPDQSFEGIAVPTAVLVVHGVRDGPTLCLTAALHGDELNGIEIVRRVLYELDPQQLSGTVIGVPIVNLHGFRRSSRYLPDRRDLNRFFPGAARGSSASRIAHSFFEQVVRRCNALVDIHTGSFQRTNLPQLRADMKVPAVADLTAGFTATSVLHSAGEAGTLRRAAVEAGIPAVTLETGEPGRLQENKIEHGTQGIAGLLDHLGMRRARERAPRARAGLLRIDLGARRSRRALVRRREPRAARAHGRAARHGHRSDHQRPLRAARAAGRARARHGAQPGGDAGLRGVPHRHPDDRVRPREPRRRGARRARRPRRLPRRRLAEGSAPPPDEENS